MLLGCLYFFLFPFFFACIEATIEESKGPDALEKCMNRLENALQERAGKKSNGKDQKPAEKKKPKSSKGKDQPKAKSVAKKVSKSKSAPPKKTAKKAAEKSKGEGKLNPLIPDSLKRKFRDGCSKCRHRKGCTPSCWAMRGYLLRR